MRAATWVLVFLPMLCLAAAQKQTYIARYLTDFPGPQVYKDPTDGTLLYVESDGRHVAAISSVRQSDVLLRAQGTATHA